MQYFIIYLIFTSVSYSEDLPIKIGWNLVSGISTSASDLVNENSKIMIVWGFKNNRWKVKLGVDLSSYQKVYERYEALESLDSKSGYYIYAKSDGVIHNTETDLIDYDLEYFNQLNGGWHLVSGQSFNLTEMLANKHSRLSTAFSFNSGNYHISERIKSDKYGHLNKFDGKMLPKQAYWLKIESELDSEKWNFLTEGSVCSSPAISSDGTIFVGSDDGRLYAISVEGIMRWSIVVGKANFFSPVIGADGTIYFAGGGKLYAINSNGSLKWSVTLDSGTSSSPVIGVDGSIYVGSYFGRVFSISQEGIIQWSYLTDGIMCGSIVSNSFGTIYVGSYLGKSITALTRYGIKKWTFVTDSGLSSNLSLDKDGTLYLATRDNKVYAINDDGSQKWVFQTEGVVHSTPIVDFDGTVYFGSMDSNVYAISQTGQKLWSVQLGGEIKSTAAITKSGALIIGCTDGSLYSVLANGVIKSKVFIGDSIISSPTVDDDGIIYVGSANGKLHAIKSDEQGLAKTFWPKFGGSQVNRLNFH